MSGALKPVLIHIVESALRELADEQYQRRVWLHGSRTEVSSLNEAVAALFNDSGLDEALEKNPVTFSTTIDEELKQLRGMLRTSLESQAQRGTAAVINSPEWMTIRRAASRLLAEIRSRG